MTIEWQRGGSRVTFPVLLEIDRGTMFKQRFKRHVRSRIEFVRGGEYEKVFGTKAAMIVYAATGERPEQWEARRRALAEWTKEVLAEARVTTWAPMFRFLAFSFGEISGRIGRRRLCCLRGELDEESERLAFAPFSES